MTPNKLFPLEVSNVESHALVVKEANDSRLWHLWYGHLNVNGPKLLSQKDMVYKLPKIESVSVYEGCIYRKQCKNPFLVGKSKRATSILELVHVDLVGSMKAQFAWWKYVFFTVCR